MDLISFRRFFVLFFSWSPCEAMIIILKVRANSLSEIITLTLAGVMSYEFLKRPL